MPSADVRVGFVPSEYRIPGVDCLGGPAAHRLGRAPAQELDGRLQRRVVEAGGLPVHLRLEPDANSVPSLQATSTWVNGAGYEPAAVATFLRVADYYLVAQAHAHHHTVVTHEIVSNSTKRIKIPNVCLQSAEGTEFRQVRKRPGFRQHLPL